MGNDQMGTLVEILKKIPWVRSWKIVKKLIQDVAFDRAERAVKLGYALCRRHGDPVVMWETEKRHTFKCPVCGQEEYTGAVSVSSEPDPPRRFFPRNRL